jgi:hypothetical protein
MLSQQVCGITLGYEDLNDHEQLPKDAVLGIWREATIWPNRWLARAH